MLQSIGESKLVKPICGLMLTSMVLSFSIGILNASIPSEANAQPAVTEVSPKISNSPKQTAPESRHATAGRQMAQVGSEDKSRGELDIQKNSVASNETTWKTGTSWKPATNVETTPAKTSQPKPNSNMDVYLLARVIYAESRGEPFEGQVAVGAVLMNRLKDSRFPKNLSQIIFKRGEFCTVRDGQIWKNPSPEAIRAARLAAAGWDPTGGALYFYNPAKTTSRWIWSRPVVNRIGNHIFAA